MNTLAEARQFPGNGLAKWLAAWVASGLASWLASCLASALALLVSGAVPAMAEEALPMFSACQPSTVPELPQRWHATGLMLPFVRQQLDVGDFVYDGAIPAMRATIYGLQSGRIDLLVTETETYQINGPSEAPESCSPLGRKYAPPPSRWLGSNPRCDGEAPVATRPAQWWKTADADGRAQWQWYATETRLPWRTMFPARMSQPAVIGDYGISYFPTFTALTETSLAQLRDFCESHPQKPTHSQVSAQSARELMALSPDILETERAERTRALIPGLSRQACAGLTAPRWPNQFVMTAILSPVPVRYTPLPTMLFYDWEQAGTLFGYLYESRTRPPAIEMISILTKGVGYGIERLPNGAFACAAKSPGVVRPDWMQVAGCNCEAVIDHNPAFGADEISAIRACPVRNEGLHVNWAWYTTAGRPILFAEPDAIGMGLNIADYYDWRPGEKMAQDAFALPLLCTRPDRPGLPPVGHGLPPASTANCVDCHTTQR